MKRTSGLFFVSSVLCAVVLSFAVSAVFAQDYPQKAIRIIVPYAPGGSNDVTARIIADKLNEVLGQRGLVDNRPGADQRIGADMVAKAAPDGYTLLLTSTPSTFPCLFKKLPFDVEKDFVGITIGGRSPNFLFVNPSVPAKTVDELVKLAKSQPGKLNYATTGVGQMPHLNGEMFKMLAGVDIMHVPFKGSSESVKAVLGGHVEMGFGSVASSISQVQAGTLRALAITGDKRSPLAPDVPTMVESGLNFVTYTWNGIFAPAKTPKEIVTKLNTAIVKILKMPDVVESLKNNGLDASPSTPEELTAFMKEDIVKWAKVVKAAGIEPQ